MNLLTKLIMIPVFGLSIDIPAEYRSSLQDKSPFGNRFWRIESITIQPALDVNMDGRPDTDLLILTPICERDDVNQYRSDGIIVTDHGKLHCEDDDESKEETGTWSFDSKTKKLKMQKYDGRKPVEAILKEHSDAHVVFVSNITSAKGTHTIRTVLKAK